VDIRFFYIIVVGLVGWLFFLYRLQVAEVERLKEQIKEIEISREVRKIEAEDFTQKYEQIRHIIKERGRDEKSDVNLSRGKHTIVL